MAFDVAPLPGNLPFGARVTGLSVTDLTSEDVRTRLRDLWVDKGVIVFKNMGSDPDTHVALSEVFGKAAPHPVREAHFEGRPELSDVRYNPDDGHLFRVDGALRAGWLPWHTDQIYTDKINHGGVLRPLICPKEHGETGFIDRISAYQRLPQALKDRIAGLHVVYQLDLDCSQQRFGKLSEVELVRMSDMGARIQARKHEFPRTVHPITFEQPRTGRTVLNVSPWFSLGLAEMPGAEGDALLQEVLDRSLDESLAYLHRWEMGDMVIWDNWRMLHSTPGISPDGERWLQRTAIVGDYGLGRFESHPEKIDAALSMNL